MDESGVEPETFRMLSERATNYATRPIVGGGVQGRYKLSKLSAKKVRKRLAQMSRNFWLAQLEEYNG